MANPFIGEIRMFGGNFAPAGWAFCNGALIAISENDTLFNLIGTTYGGDGQNTFALPDLRGRAAVHAGQGPGITQNYVIGEMAGVEQVTLTTQQLPSHNHAFVASGDAANQTTVSNGVVAFPPSLAMYFASAPDAALNVAAGNAATGASQTITLVTGATVNSAGVSLSPITTNTPIIVGIGSNAETVTPTAVSNCNLPSTQTPAPGQPGPWQTVGQQLPSV